MLDFQDMLPTELTSTLLGPRSGDRCRQMSDISNFGRLCKPSFPPRRNFARNNKPGLGNLKLRRRAGLSSG